MPRLGPAKKEFLREHKVAILVTGLVISTVVIVAMSRGLRMHDDFLEEKGLLDEYYFEPEAVE